MKIFTRKPVRKFGTPLFAFLVLCFVANLHSALAEQKDISQTEFMDMAKSSLIVLDVRTPDEFKEGHVPGAINLPLGNLPEQFTSLGNKEQKIVVYCRSGFRAGKAIKLLNEKGYLNTLHLDGDFKAWLAADLPISTP